MANDFEQFHLCVVRNDTGESILKLDKSDPFIFSLYYYQITTLTTNEKLYGFGERR